MSDKRILTIVEQIIEDPVSGFVFKFISTASESPSRILFRPKSQTEWREFLFDKNGEFSGATSRVAADDPNSPKLRLVK